ncbi:MAG: 1-phosphofructokinase family hexose kinase [Planctomycetota bacterium]|jgi:1-phosphofructokinase family hexose kinase
MSRPDTIITVGICPCWDILCHVDGLKWGNHKRLQAQHLVCAGKALNISRALAWLEIKTIAAGLWGQSDYPQMVESTKAIRDYVDIRFTKVPGQTRHNVTIFDTRAGREMHLRAESRLATRESLQRLAADLENLVTEGSIVVFAGSVPSGELLDECLAVITKARDTGAMVAVDTSGKALAETVRSKGIWLIKPNLKELRQLLGEYVPDRTGAIVKAGRKLCDAVGIVLVSRGAKGATLITGDAALHGQVTRRAGKTVGTVGCGDYLLAGLLAGMREKNDLESALLKAVKVAAARAYGLTQKMNWPDVESRIEASVRLL